jgi:hypothetical protein
MDRAEAEDAVRALQAEFRSVEQTVQDGMARLRGISKVVEGYGEMYPGLLEAVRGHASQAAHPSAQPGERPRGQEAIRLVLSGFPGRMWTVADVVAELAQREWLPDSEVPAAAVRTALERLVTSDRDITKVKDAHGTVRFTYSAAARGEVA